MSKQYDLKGSWTSPSFLFLPFVAVVLANLKLLGVIDWSWWWVLSPLVFHAFGGVLFLFAVLLMTLAVVLLSTSRAVRFMEEKFKSLTKENKNG
jgi:hypothetical protein